MTVLGGFICLLLVTGIVSGIYPALFLSSFTPIKILKGQIPAGGHTRSSVARRLLVIVQFTISIVLIIGTIIIYQQLDYMKNKDLGFDKENLIYLKTEDFSGKYDAIKNELLQHPEITGVSASGDMVLTIGDNTGANWEGKEKNAKYISFPSLFITEDFLQTFRLQLAEGRFFSKQFPADKTNAFVLNEAAVKAMRIKDPIGKKFNAWGKDGKIIGVVKDFNFRSLHSEVEPLILSLYGFRHLYVRMNSNDIGKTIETVKQIYHKHYPEHEFEVHFFDEEIDNLYQSERRMGSIFAYFSILAIFIACLGLFGLVSFVSENKTKEIGIRKVLGASFADVVSILTRDITMWALLANIVAWPVAYVAMNRWLQNFAYRMEIRWWVFLLAGGLTLLIALLTVCYEAVKAATANPVESLRYE
jgi:putative ABC transport system permease protein